MTTPEEGRLGATLSILRSRLFSIYLLASIEHLPTRARFRDPAAFGLFPGLCRVTVILFSPNRFNRRRLCRIAAYTIFLSRSNDISRIDFTRLMIYQTTRSRTHTMTFNRLILRLKRTLLCDKREQKPNLDNMNIVRTAAGGPSFPTCARC